MLKYFSSEREGQLEFFYDYLKLIDKNLILDDILNDNTDGVINGNILEFKLKINSLNEVLFQTIKYLSAMRIKGKSIPKNILLISLNDAIIYLYNSLDYLNDIEKVYIGNASKNNIKFIAQKPLKILNYKENELDETKLIELLRENNFTKINIDENCIVGWAERFYREIPNAKKADFIGDLEGKVKIVGEIRKPNKFKDFINPYVGSNNIKFQYLMDKLNDTIQKKNLGAFYTPELYVKKSIELLRMAIKDVPFENDYIILDRCAGTGNLEKLLTDEELSHCILSTVEYYEYKVMLELLGDKVRHIIPPTEKEDTFNMGLVRGADALSEEYINNEVIRQYIENPNCTIIIFENPPYSEVNGTTMGNGRKANWKNSYVASQMKKEVKGVATNDLSNLFIWSAFKYYLRQPTDSYIVFSPIKYWKSQNLISKVFIKGFAFNRKFFHTKIDACISCIYWKNVNNNNLKRFELEAYNIIDNKIIYEEILNIEKVNSLISQYYDKREFEEDINNGIALNLDGTELIENNKIRVQKKFNSNIIAYLVANGQGFDNPDLNSGLTRVARYDGNGAFLRDDNFLPILPIFSASRYIKYNRNWTERGRVMKSADMKNKYFKDLTMGKLNNFLLKNLLYVCFEPQNHCRTLEGSDGRFYKNEFCLDITNGETIASKELKKLKLNKFEEKLILAWENVLNSAKETKEYYSKFTYGLYQIDTELNIKIKNKITEKLEYKYPELNGNIKSLKSFVKEYYLNEIVPILFKYEFLK